VLVSKIISHLGPNPRKGGRPPNESRIEKKISVCWCEKEGVELEREFKFDTKIIMISMISMIEYVM
jgi:hypothetical protein